jgi:hypothetical protein
VVSSDVGDGTPPTFATPVVRGNTVEPSILVEGVTVAANGNVATNGMSTAPVGGDAIVPTPVGGGGSGVIVVVMNHGTRSGDSDGSDVSDSEDEDKGLDAEKEEVQMKELQKVSLLRRKPRKDRSLEDFKFLYE